MKIAILTRNEERSPKVLATALQSQLQELGATAVLLYKTDLLLRLNPVSFRVSLSFFLCVYQRIKFFWHDQHFLKELSQFDLIILSECIPNAFWRQHYAIEKLKLKIKRPVFLYEVYYLGNAPTQERKLKENEDCLQERFDWHLSVSGVTEIKLHERVPWTCIGLKLDRTGLRPRKKKEFVALIDFPHLGYEMQRALQIEVLSELKIKTIILEGNYTIEEIRNIYQQVCIYFMQSSESFGLPLAECLASGSYIFTPNSAWPMSWRLNDHPEIHQEGELPEIFKVYRSKNELKGMLVNLVDKYSENTPHEVFDLFIKYYPHYYYGNNEALKKVLENVKNV